MQQEKTFQYVIQGKNGLFYSGCYQNGLPHFVSRESGEFWRYASLPSACEAVLNLTLDEDKFDAEQIYEAQILREEVSPAPVYESWVEYMNSDGHLI